MKIKKCKKCEEYKTLDNFSKIKNKKRKVIYFCSYCKKCYCKKYDRNSSKKNSDRIRKADKKYQAKKRFLKPAEKKKTTDLYFKKYPERYRAMYLVRMAIKKGLLKRGKCRDCDRADTQGHHPDYTKPLKVIWLCPSHHKLEDMKGRILLEN